MASGASAGSRADDRAGPARDRHGPDRLGRNRNPYRSPHGIMSAPGMTTFKTMLSRPAVPIAVGLIALAFGGCGGSDEKKDGGTSDEAAIKTVLVQLQKASVAGDGKQICTQIFTAKLADSVTRSSTTGSCEKEVRSKLFSPDTKLTVQNVTVTDPANATATIKEANGNVSTVFFVRQSGRWRIRS